MNKKWHFASLTTLANFTNLFIGGEKDSRNLISLVLSLENKTWKAVSELHKPVSRHCSVQINEDTIYIIGGHMGSASFSDETMSFDTLTSKSSTIGAKLNRGRQLHSCAMLNGNQVIVVGGRDSWGGLKSVETFDIRTSEKWIERKNLELPFGISYAQLVANPSGIKFRLNKYFFCNYLY